MSEILIVVTPGGHMTDRYWLDPREVWTVTNPDGKLVAYVWEPASPPVPLPTAPVEPPVDRSWLQVEDT